MPPIIASVLLALGTSLSTAMTAAYIISSIGASIVLGAVSRMIVSAATGHPTLSGSVASRSIETRQADEPFED
jgi:predicted phage tail protein